MSHDTLVRRVTVALAIATLAGAGAAAATVRHDGTVQLQASLAERKLHVRAGDDTMSYDIAVGRGSKPTPTGSFTIRKIVWNPAWVPPAEKWARDKKPQPPGAPKNPMKVVKIFFQEPDYYIHGTDDIESLGQEASHGCLRMHPDDAYALARYLMEHGGQPRDESWFWRILHFRSETKTVYLQNPIPITIAN